MGVVVLSRSVSVTQEVGQLERFFSDFSNFGANKTLFGSNVRYTPIRTCRCREYEFLHVAEELLVADVLSFHDLILFPKGGRVDAHRPRRSHFVFRAPSILTDRCGRESRQDGTSLYRRRANRDAADSSKTSNKGIEIRYPFRREIYVEDAGER